MAETSERDLIGGIDLHDDAYVVRQSLVRNKYAVEDATGRVVLRGKQKLLRMKEQFPFVDADGTEVFTVRAQNVFDVAGGYTLEDAATGEAFAVVEKAFTLFKHTYRVRSPDGELWATIESEDALVMALKSFSAVFGLIPHEYSVTDADGTRIGTITERFSIRDVYDVEIGDTGDAPREAIIAAAVAIDALEGN